MAIHPGPGDMNPGRVSVRLVCPSCSATYDVGLLMALEEEREPAGGGVG